MKSNALKKRGQKYTAAERKRTKALYLEALVRSGGLKTQALKNAGSLTFDTVQQWKDRDPDFAAAEAIAIERGCEQFGDFVEAKLMDRISQGDTTAIIFALKTKYKKRGYIEKTEVAAEVTGKGFEIVVRDERTADELRRLKDTE